MEKFEGIKYRLVRQDNYERILAEMGANYVSRKLLPKIKSSLQLIKKSDNIYVLDTRRNFLRQSIEFSANEEFEEKTMSGQKVKSVITFENNTMTHIQQSEPPLKIVRNFFSDEMYEFDRHCQSMELENFFNIVYQLNRIEGVDGYCSYMNYGQSKRDNMLSTNQYVYLRHTGCGFDYNLTIIRGMSRYQNSYRARENYKELTMSNGICRSSLQIIGNKIIHTQNGKKHKVTVREFFPDRMITTKTVDKSVVLVKHYVAIQMLRYGSYNF